MDPPELLDARLRRPTPSEAPAPELLVIRRSKRAKAIAWALQGAILVLGVLLLVSF